MDELENLEENEDEHDDSVSDREEETDRDDKRLESIELLENLALSFLSQLNDALSDRDGDDASQTTGSKNNKRRITFEIADRTYRSQCRVLQFPKRTKGPSIKPIAQLLRVVDIAHEALVNNTPVTKR